MLDAVDAAQGASALAAFSLAWFMLLLCWHWAHARRDSRWFRMRARADGLIDHLLAGGGLDEPGAAELRRRPGVLAEALAARRPDPARGAYLAERLEAAGLARELRRQASRRFGRGQVLAIDALGALPCHETERVLREIWFRATGEPRVAALQALEDIGRPLPLGAVLITLDRGETAVSPRMIVLLQHLVSTRAEAAAQLALSPKLGLQARTALLRAIARSTRPDRPLRPPQEPSAQALSAEPAPAWSGEAAA